MPLSDVQSTIAKIFAAVLGISAIGLLVLAVAIALIVRAGLRPLRAVAETATRVANVPMAAGAVSITERVPDAEADPRTEIGRVGHALNTLLDHVDASLDARQHNEERMRRFVADASHELRTPLASIRGYSELSLRGLRMAREPRRGIDDDDAAPVAEDPTEQSLERIQAQSLRMTTLVEDLLLLARLDEGQELVYGTVDLTRLAIEAVGDARPAGPDHVWVLDVGEVPVVIAGDAARLHQVAANLLANASTHTPAGTTVTVSVEREGTDAVLRVRDDGPGIDPAVRDELFERFSRADRSRARKTGGTGLGLSIARAIVDAHSGSISVTSVPGDTVFEVRLPARPADPARASGSVAREGVGRDRPRLLERGGELRDQPGRARDVGVARGDVRDDPQQSLRVESHSARPQPVPRQVGGLIPREHDHRDSGCLDLVAERQFRGIRRDVDEHDVAVLPREAQVAQLRDERGDPDAGGDHEDRGSSPWRAGRSRPTRR